jgi:hypothetical protein
MKRKIGGCAYIIFIGIMLFTVSCKSYRNVEKLKPFMERDQEGNYVAEKEFSKIKKEEKILVELVDGKSYYMNYGSFADKILQGKVWRDFRNSGKIEPYTIEIPHDKIKNVKILRPNVGLTIGIPLGILGLTFLVTLIVVASEGFYVW